jgi:hypothetical protein
MPIYAVFRKHIAQKLLLSYFALLKKILYFIQIIFIFLTKSHKIELASTTWIKAILYCSAIYCSADNFLNFYQQSCLPWVHSDYMNSIYEVIVAPLFHIYNISSLSWFQFNKSILLTYMLCISRFFIILYIWLNHIRTFFLLTSRWPYILSAKSKNHDKLRIIIVCVLFEWGKTGQRR